MQRTVLPYRKEVDGLRAIAVLAVVFYHADFTWFSGGYVGVDVFFVISGYLITSLILVGIEGGQFTLKHFWMRRTRRILPALFTVCLLSAPVAWYLMMPYQLEQFALSAGAAALFVANIYMWRNSGYFTDDAIEIPLLHTWSLSVEEQFYLTYPIFIIIVIKYIGHRFLTITLMGLLLVSLVTAQWGAHNAPVANFFILPTRAWELLMGAVAARLLASGLPENPRLADLFALVGLALIVFAIVFFADNTPNPSFFTLAPTIGATLIILFATPETIVGKLLSTRSMVGIGLISYSFYLWHYPVFSFAKLADLPGLNGLLPWILIMVSVGLAYLSWRFVENPFRNPNVTRPFTVLSAAGVGFALCIGLAAMGKLTKGWEENFVSRFGQPGMAIIRALNTRGVDGMQKNDGCRFWSETADEAFLKRFRACALTQGPATLVFGDSHAMDLYNALYLNSKQPFLVGLLKGGCRLYQEEPNCSYEDVTKLANDFPNKIGLALYTQSGSYLLNWKGPNSEIRENSIMAVSRYLTNLSELTTTIWLGPQIEPGIDLRKIHPGTGRRPPLGRANINAIEKLDKKLQIHSKKHSSFTYVSKLQAVNYDHKRDFLVDGEYTYSDTDHWSTFGEKLYGTRLSTHLRALGYNGF